MASNKNSLSKVIKKAFQVMAEKELASDMMTSGEVDGMMGDIERDGGKALVRTVFKNICRDLKTGDPDIHGCEFEDIIKGTFTPVPAGYNLLVHLPVDLNTTVSPEADPEIINLVENDPEEDFTHEEAVEGVKAFPRRVRVKGDFYVYSTLPGYSKQTLNGRLGAQDEPVRAYNLIGHPSNWEGTLRTLKAQTAIERFHPRSAGEIARIFLEDKDPNAGLHDVQFPMFLENQQLHDFVVDNIDRLGYERLADHFMTHWRIQDAVSDMWKLSPELQAAYPSRDHWFNGINIGEGWFDLMDEVQIIMRMAS